MFIVYKAKPKVFLKQTKIIFVDFKKEVKINGSIISVVGKTTVEDYGAFSMYTKSPIRTIMKSDQTIIRKNL